MTKEMIRAIKIIRDAENHLIDAAEGVLPSTRLDKMLKDIDRFLKDTGIREVKS